MKGEGQAQLLYQRELEGESEHMKGGNREARGSWSTVCDALRAFLACLLRRRRDGARLELSLCV